MDRLEELVEEGAEDGGVIVGDVTLSAGGLYSGGGMGGEDIEPDRRGGCRWDEETGRKRLTHRPKPG